MDVVRSLSPPSSPASLVASGDHEAGFSGGGAPFSCYHSRSRKGSYRAMVGSPPPARSVFFCDAFSDEEPRHFLDSCFLCKKPLAGNRDIFMYRGNTPFCSEECRQEQIEIDEAKEKKTSPLKQQQQRSSPSKSPKVHVRATGTVVAG